MYVMDIVSKEDDLTTFVVVLLVTPPLAVQIPFDEVNGEEEQNCICRTYSSEMFVQQKGGVCHAWIRSAWLQLFSEDLLSHVVYTAYHKEYPCNQYPSAASRLLLVVVCDPVVKIFYIFLCKASYPLDIC